MFPSMVQLNHKQKKRGKKCFKQRNAPYAEKSSADYRLPSTHTKLNQTIFAVGTAIVNTKK